MPLKILNMAFRRYCGLSLSSCTFLRPNFVIALTRVFHPWQSSTFSTSHLPSFLRVDHPHWASLLFFLVSIPAISIRPIVLLLVTPLRLQRHLSMFPFWFCLVQKGTNAMRCVVRLKIFHHGGTRHFIGAIQ
jgi:hypothetical protein